MKQQIEIFLMAGYETTAATTSYTILMLAMHPHIQEKVYDELHTVFDTQDEETTYEHIQKLHLLDRVIKETMRLFPIAIGIFRSVTADTQLTTCVVPKGTSVMLSIYTMQRVRHQTSSSIKLEHFQNLNFI